MTYLVSKRDPNDRVSIPVPNAFGIKGVVYFVQFLVPDDMRHRLVGWPAANYDWYAPTVSG